MKFQGKALRWQHVDGVIDVVLHQAPANEIGTVLLTELESLANYAVVCAGIDQPVTIGAGQAGGAARALVFTSETPCFCAGADLRELQGKLAEARKKGMSDEGVATEVGVFIDRIHETFDRLDTAPLLTVAGVHGACLGGGFELALTCDVIVADKSARFGFPELRLGLVPGFGGIPRLTRDAGNAVARDLLFTGRSIRASRAQELGIVSQVVARGEAAGVARRVAEQACSFEGETFRRAKVFTKRLPAAELALERETFLGMVTRPVVLEALTDFVARDGKDAMPYLPKAVPRTAPKIEA